MRKERRARKEIERRETSGKLRFRDASLGTCYSSRPELFARSPNWSKWEPSFAGAAGVDRSFIYITHRRNVDNREIDITGDPRARCSAMSPLPRICIQAYADKQHRRVRAALECINSRGSEPKGHAGVSRFQLRICIYRCARCLFPFARRGQGM